MPVSNGFIRDTRFSVNPADDLVSKYQGFAASASGTTTCTTTINNDPAPQHGVKKTALMLDWIYAVATGTGAMDVVVTAGSTERCRFRLITNQPLQLSMTNAPITTEAGEALTVTISGGTASACALTIGGRRMVIL